MTNRDRKPRPRIQARRGVVVRDFAIFQVKLLIDGGKDIVLSALSVLALVLDLLSGGGRKPRIFYSVLAMSERFDLWLNLSGAVSRLEEEQLDDDGLFGASEAGSDSLLGKVEQMVRGGDRPRKGPRDSRDATPSRDKPGSSRDESGSSRDESPSRES